MTGSNVNNEFGELIGVAGTFAFADGHNPIFSEFVSLAKASEFQTVTVPAPASLTQETVYGWWPIASGVSIVGALSGAILPAWKAVRQDVIQALAYE